MKKSEAGAREVCFDWTHSIEVDVVQLVLMNAWHNKHTTITTLKPLLAYPSRVQIVASSHLLKDGSSRGMGGGLKESN